MLTKQQHIDNAKAFADYLLYDLSNDLEEEGLEYTAGDVVEAGITIKRLLSYMEKENA